MDSNIIVKVIAVGIPAMIIAFGFIAFMTGSGVEALTGDAEMKTVGINMMIAGTLIYTFEFVAFILNDYAQR